MTRLDALDWFIVVVFLLANLLLGLYQSRGIKSARDYQLGTRTLPWWALGISVIATYISALSFLGGPAWAYGDGMAALAIHINYPVVVFIVVVLFLPFFYNSGVASIYEYLERRFGVASRSVMAGLFLTTQTLTTASILTATSVVITFATGLDTYTAIVAMTAVVLAYTLFGGLNAVIWTDVLQGVILLAGAGVVLFAVASEVSPMSSALSQLAIAGKLDPINTTLDFSIAPTVWAGVFAMTLFHTTVYGANQMMVQRALAAKNIGDAKKSYLMMGFAGFFIYFIFFFIGALLFVYYKGEPFEQPNSIILVFAKSLAIPGLMGVLAAAILAASMSSLSSAFNSLATVLVTDFYQRFFRKQANDDECLRASRWFTAAWALLVIPVAFAFVGSGGSILEQLSKAGSYFVGAQLSMFGMGFFSKNISQRGLLSGVFASFVALYCVINGVPFVAWTPPTIAWPWFVVIGASVSVSVAWIVSRIFDGRQTNWHVQSVPGQLHRFKSQGLAERDNGWYLVPGRVDSACWWLLVLFALIVIGLSLFSLIGGA